MRQRYLVIAVALGLFLPAMANRVEAQAIGTGVGADPFSLYFGYYLPQQAAVAARPTPMDTLNANTQIRQDNALQERSGLYDPVSPYAEEEMDPFKPYGSGRAKERLARPHMFPGSTSAAAMRGMGPPLYYNRTARYYPTLRTGRGPNRNLAVTKRGVGRAGGGGMPGMGNMGMPSMNPGPR